MKPERQANFEKVLAVCLKSQARPRRICRAVMDNGVCRLLTGHDTQHRTSAGRRFNKLLRLRRRLGGKSN